MKILFNCVVNIRGGAIQNAANFICHGLDDESNEYLFLVSKPVYELLQNWNKIDNRVIKLAHPLESSSTKKEVAEIEKSFSPDIVYTMAGPTYLRFNSMHVLGISDGFITHSKFLDFFYNQSLYKGFKFLCKTILKGWSSRVSADKFIFQTETARTGYCKRYFLNKNNSTVVPNALGKSFLDLKDIEVIDHYDSNVTVFCPFANYPHKDIDILKRMIKLVSSDNFNFHLKGYHIRFVVTIDEDDIFAREIDELNTQTSFMQIENIGPYSYSDSLNLYKNCHIVFMPTILETFSTSYLEALATGRLLLTADIDSSREICGNAAVYFKPTDEVDAMRKLLNIIKKNCLPNVRLSKNIINFYGDYEKRYSNLIGAVKYFKS